MQLQRSCLQIIKHLIVGVSEKTVGKRPCEGNIIPIFIQWKSEILKDFITYYLK